MPISKTIEGLITELPCDVYYQDPPYSGEGWYMAPGSASASADTSDKKEGAASIKVHEIQGYYPSGTTEQWMTNNNCPQHPTNRLHIWHKAVPGSGATVVWQLQMFVLVAGLPVMTTIVSKSGAESWTFKAVTLPDLLASEPPWNYHIVKMLYQITGAYAKYADDWIDHLVISTTQYLTVTGLTPGQKVKLYRASDDSLLDTQTCAGGSTQVIFDIDAQDYPIYFYMKIYATDGATLIETTPSYRMCGGDSWAWTAPAGTLTMESTAFVIIRSAGSGTPKSATVTATLTTPGGAPYPGVTIYFTTNRGTVTPGSDVTDANGQVETVLASGTHGIAVVKANWPGDASVPAAVGFMTHHVFHTAEVGDTEKKFQLYVEGLELDYVDGSYVLSTSSDPQEWHAQIPEWDGDIIKRGLVSIYRKGVLEYSGILLKVGRPMSASPNILIGGVDSKHLLTDRVVTLKDYSAKTLAYIAADLLDSYSCGVTLGALGDYPVSFSITFADESLTSAFTHLCDVLGWFYRVNSDRTLDIKSSFGLTRDVGFEQGVSFFQVNNDEDYTQISNSVRMRGNEDLVSTQMNASSIEELGLVEGVAFQKSITVQATLDLAAVAELDRRVSGAVQISGQVLDDNDVGAWGVDDWITLTASENDLSGLYKVVRITRDMKDPNFAEIELENEAAVRLADIIEKIRRQLKDLSAKTAI